MPRERPPSRKSWRSRNPAKSLVKMRSLALKMEVLLNEIEDLMQALRFIGYGMESHHVDEGSPISTLAWTAVQRLVALREIWNGKLEA